VAEVKVLIYERNMDLWDCNKCTKLT